MRDKKIKKQQVDLPTLFTPNSTDRMETLEPEPKAKEEIDQQVKLIQNQE